MSDFSTDDNPAAVLPTQPNRRRWLTLLLATIIFLTGTIVGAAGAVLIAVRRLEHVLHHPEVMPDRLTARLRTVLDLSPEQARDVREILGRRQQGLQAVRRDTYPRVDRELELTRREIAEVLDDGQREAWNRWFAKTRERFLPPPPPSPAPAPPSPAP